MTSSEETKIIYHVDDEETPYLVKIPKPPAQVTLGDFKNVINRPNYKFFFKSMDDGFGVVKEEIVDDDALLPCFNGRVVSWVVPPDEDGQSVHSGDGMFNPVANVSRSSTMRKGVDNSDAESITSRRSSRSRTSRRYESDAERRSRRHRDRLDDGTSVMSSDIETTSFVDSDEESQMSSTTESSRYVGGQRRRRRKRQRMPRVERCQSFSTITESTMSLNIITVTLNMDKINFLGISIVGQANKKGDGGIYVGSVMKGGAVDADGRIEPGDMILAVGDVNFENMSNDDAVRVLRECVHKPGPIMLTVAKCWDPTPKGYFTVPKNDVTRPIDPAAWLQHSEAVRASGGLLGGGTGSPSMSTMTSTSDSLTSSIPEADRYLDHPDLSDYGLTIETDMHTIVKVMASTESGLVVRDRMWLKITIPNAFIGSDLVDWLFAHVEGFQDRRDARKYASSLLKAGLIRHTVNKITFSEQCYYVFGDLDNRLNSLTMQNIVGSRADTLAPLSANSQSQINSWAGQAQTSYIMAAGGVPMMPSSMMPVPTSDGGPPNYSQVFPNVYPAFNPYFIQHPGSIAPSTQGVHSNHSNHTGGSGSNHSGSLKGSVKSGPPQRDADQVTLRSSGSSERSHSSKGSKRDPAMSDKASLLSFQMDNMSIDGSVNSMQMVTAQMIPPGAQMIPPNTQIIQLPTGQMMAVHSPPPMGPPPPPPGQVPTSNPAGGPPFTQSQEQLSNLQSMPPDLSASRQSFRMAMGNTDNEFFVDVM